MTANAPTAGSGDDDQLAVTRSWLSGLHRQTFIADRIQPESVYTWPLTKRGIVYGEPDDIDLMQTVRVSEVMTTDPDVLTSDTSLPAARREFRRTGHHGFPVLDAGRRLVGVCTLTDVAVDGDDGTPIGDVCTRQLLTVTPEDPVFLALRHMATIDVGRLPVVAAHDHQQLVGLIRRSAWSRRTARRSPGRSPPSSGPSCGACAIWRGPTSSRCASPTTARRRGDRSRSVGWPRHTLLTSVHRSGDLIMPDGSTQLQPGDRVSAIVDDEHVQQVRQLLTGSVDPDLSEES